MEWRCQCLILYSYDPDNDIYIDTCHILTLNAQRLVFEQYRTRSGHPDTSHYELNKVQ